MNRRSTLITSAAITGVLLAGTTAVAANIGILNTANDDPIGELSAVADITTSTEPDPVPTSPEPQVIDVYVDETVPSTSSAERAAEADVGGQQYAVDDAGSVTIERTDSGIRVGDVAAKDGWMWSSTQTSENELSIEFVSGDATYLFYAGLRPDGTIEVRVDQPIVRTVQVPAPPAAASSASGTPAPTATVSSSDYDDDDDERDDDERDERDDDERHEDEEHEGGDDDD